MPSDPLSDVLSFLKPRTIIAGGFDLGGDWGLRFEKHEGLKCYALVTGTAWLTIDGVDQPIALKAGECVLLPSGRRFLISARPGADGIRFADLPQADWDGGVVTLNGGGDTMMLGGHFDYSGAHAELLLGAMPSVSPLRDGADKVDLFWALDRMRRELVQARPGANLLLQTLAHLMLVEALRIYLEQESGRGVGWLFALGDPKIAPAITAIHAKPGERWTLPLLARSAGMSRSKFAQRFKAVCGWPPIDYLKRWRMMLACDRLIAGRETTTAIALSLGYESEAAFSTAFKRIMGASPREYARRSR